MLVQKTLPKTQLIIFGVLIAVALGVIGYLVFSKILLPKGINLSGLTGKTQVQLFEGKVPLPDVRGFDENFFTNDLIKDLRNSADLPIEADNITRKDNPFAPLIVTETKAATPSGRRTSF